MSLSMFTASVPVFQRQLGALSACLGKAEAHCAARKIDPLALIQARLFPDMFALPRQVQVAADFAKNTTARLVGAEPPKWDDTEATLADLQARIGRTLDFMKGFQASQFDGAATRTITIPIRGEPRNFTGEVFLLHFAMPNFYFHCTTAYAILRHNGVELGKGDFLGAR